MKAISLVAAILFIGSAAAAAQTAAASTPHPPAFTMSGDIALWTVAIKPDKTAEFERVLSKLRTALANSSDPTRRKQAAGWKVMKIGKPMPDGNIAYVHVISPVVAGADYAVLQALYAELPKERQEVYELYRGAFAQNLALSAGTIVMDGGMPPPTP